MSSQLTYILPPCAGSAYVYFFDQSAAAWSQQGLLSSNSADVWMGRSVSLSGDTLAAGVDGYAGGRGACVVPSLMVHDVDVLSCQCLSLS